MLRCIISCIIVLFLTEILDCTEFFKWKEDYERPPTFSFGYAHQNGPHTWKDLYPESTGSNQSPINIITRLALVMEPSESLKWNGYNNTPLSMTIANDGHTGRNCKLFTGERKLQIKGKYIILNLCVCLWISPIFHVSWVKLIN